MVLSAEREMQIDQLGHRAKSFIGRACSPIAYGIDAILQRSPFIGRNHPDRPFRSPLTI